MTTKFKYLMWKIVPKKIIVIWHSIKRWIVFRYGVNFSADQSITAHILNNLRIPEGEEFFVDLACQDGVLGSQTLFLAKKGWSGVLFEADSHYFHIVSKYYSEFINVRLVRDFITPGNIVNYLDSTCCPKKFGFLSLDIDSYDYFILESILKNYRPYLMCIEINENFPPPLRFSIKYSAEFVFAEDNIYNHFQGMSISMANDLLVSNNYKIVKLEYNNLFCVPSDSEMQCMSVDEAYRNGYMLRSEKFSVFPWNEDLRNVYDMDIPDQLTYWQNRFKDFGDVFILKTEIL